VKRGDWISVGKIVPHTIDSDSGNDSDTDEED
jgi:hypothetical protein